jgi:hypothetical protein
MPKIFTNTPAIAAETATGTDPVDVKIVNMTPIDVDPGEPSDDRRCAPFDYTMEEVTDIVEPSEQIPVATFPHLAGQQPLAVAAPVALANEQFFDYQAPTVNRFAPAINTIMAFQDCLQYRQVAIQATVGPGVSSGLITFEVSNTSESTATWSALSLMDISAPGWTYIITTGINLSANTVRLFAGPLTHRYFRMRVTGAIVGGFVSVTNLYRLTPYTPIVYQVMGINNISSNIVQWAGAVVATAGIPGVVPTGGAAAQATPATANPVPTGAVDYATLTRRIISDSQGHQIVAGPDPGRDANPVKVQDAPGRLGQFNQTELLELILNQLQLLSFYMKELPLMLNTGRNFIEEIADFQNTADRQ